MKKKEEQTVRVLQVLGGTGLGGAESRVTRTCIGASTRQEYSLTLRSIRPRRAFLMMKYGLWGEISMRCPGFRDIIFLPIERRGSVFLQSIRVMRLCMVI